jgi:lysyl-tRNA synthetase class 1
VKGELPPGHAATFRYSLLDPEADVAAEASLFRPQFRHLALLAQIPGVDITAQAAAEKGSALIEREVVILAEREQSARAWLDVYAPEDARMSIVYDAVPSLATKLDDAQRAFLRELSVRVEADAPKSGPEWQDLIFRTAIDQRLSSNRAAFAVIYASFLGRLNGPRAGWLLASLDRDFVIERLRAAADAAPVGGAA